MGHITAIFSLNFHHIASSLGMKNHLHMFFLNVSSLLFNNLSILLKMYLKGHIMVTNATFSIYMYTKSGFQFPLQHFLNFQNLQHGYFKHIMTFGLNIFKVFELRNN